MCQSKWGASVSASSSCEVPFNHGLEGKGKNEIRCSLSVLTGLTWVLLNYRVWQGVAVDLDLAVGPLL